MGQRYQPQLVIADRRISEPSTVSQDSRCFSLLKEVKKNFLLYKYIPDNGWMAPK